MADNDDFKELSSLSELDFHEETHEEDEREFYAPVSHLQGTTLDKKQQNEIDDYNYVRQVYLKMIENGQISLEVAINELRASGHPRAAEVVGGLIKQIADVSSQLLEINEKTGGQKAPQQQTNIQNNFYGSPNDLLEQIEKEEEERANAESASGEFETVEED